MTLQRVVGGVEVEPDLLGRLRIGLEETVNEQPILPVGLATMMTAFSQRLGEIWQLGRLVRLTPLQSGLHLNVYT